MQLSEITQKVEDSCKELSIFMLKWDRLHSSGVSIVNSLRSLKTKSMYVMEKTCGSSYDEMYPEGLIEKCNQLETTVLEMEAALNTLKILVQQLSALAQLDLLQNKSHSSPFNSWSTEKFSAAFQDIYDMYSEELSLKVLIKQEVAHCSRKDTLLMHVTAWEFQPFLTDVCSLLCKSVLVESRIAR